MSAGVYAIEHLTSGMRYVGSACDFKKRWGEHRSGLNSRRHHNRHLQSAWSKYGEAAFSFQILETVDDVFALLEVEQRHIDATPEALRYNSLPAAGSWLGKKHSAESRALMSAVHKGVRLSDASREKVRAACTGRKHSEASKNKMRLSALGRLFSKETRAKIGAAGRGRKHTEEAKAKISLNNGRKRLRLARGGYRPKKRPADLPAVQVPRKSR